MSKLMGPCAVPHPTFDIPGWDMKSHAPFQPEDGTLPK